MTARPPGLRSVSARRQRDVHAHGYGGNGRRVTLLRTLENRISQLVGLAESALMSYCIRVGQYLPEAVQWARGVSVIQRPSYALAVRARYSLRR